MFNTNRDMNELAMELENLKQQNLELRKQLESAQNKDGRKSQVLALLRQNKRISIVQIAERIGISTKNVSSQLTYLRQDGHNICTDVNGLKFLVED